MIFDTISAISTPPGEGGIGIIRLSGPDAISIAARIFQPDIGSVEQLASRTVHLGRAQDPESGQVLDRALITLFRAPRSYTGEDVVELSCHGGGYLLSRVLEASLRAGARLADAGEFTLRAFLHGRLDLSQAEAVLDLIRARADASLRLAESQLEGNLSEKVAEIRKPLHDLLAQLEAALDFPDDVPEPDTAEIRSVLEKGLAVSRELLETAEQGRILREGAAVVIAGRPNVGKSSVMNALLRESRAIVTPISGTTRDVLEESANLRGIPIRAIDTAGLRKPRGKVEALGIERARRQIAEADLILLVVDGSRKLSDLDRAIISELSGRKLVVALNKADLPGRVKTEDLVLILKAHGHREIPVVSLSASTGDGLHMLEDSLVNALVGSNEGLQDGAVVANLRHRDALRRAAESLEAALDTLDASEALDLLTTDLTAAIGAFDEITGESVQEDLLESIFSRFCIGK